MARTNVPTYSRMPELSPIPRRPVSQKWNIVPNLNASTTYDELRMKHAQKLKHVEQLMKAEGEDPLTSLLVVDAIQKHSIDHHFQEEIDAMLRRRGDFIRNSQDLHQVSLYFRLMRQDGYHVPADIFLKFKDKEGRFDIGKLRRDVTALMALYEASQLRVDGEDILDEAEHFSSKFLNQWLTQVEHSTAAIIANTLRHPCNRSSARFKAKGFSYGFKGINGWERPLQELSDVEFLIARGKHHQELVQVSKWWNNLGLAKEFKEARNQPLKWYSWPMAALPDLNLSDERVDLTKCISFIYLIDDIFDLYGKPDELALFTKAVNRWELSAADQLPNYMKKCLRTLFEVTNEIGYNIQIRNRYFNPISYLKNSWARLCNAFLVEARWFASQDLPKADEYLKNGRVSTGVEVVLVHLFFLLGLGAMEDCSTNLKSVSGIISSIATILRLWDDLGSAKDEDQDGYDGSYIDCYMNEHKGVSIEAARGHVFELISDEWKQLNKECLGLSRFMSSFKKASLNLVKMVPLMYDYDSDRRLPVLEEYIKSMLYDDLLPLVSKTD